MGQNGGKDDGDTSEKRTPVFRVTSPSSGRLKSKCHGKLSIHCAADLEIVEIIFRTIASANELNLNGAVAEICEEQETFHDRTGQPVVRDNRVPHSYHT